MRKPLIFTFGPSERLSAAVESGSCGTVELCVLSGTCFFCVGFSVVFCVDLVVVAGAGTVFFGVHLGATAQEVVDNFSQHGLILLENLSDDDALVFGHNSDYYTFGGMQWVNLTVNLNNGKFYNISFYNPRNTKKEAMDDFNYVVANVEKKYKLMDFDPQDSTIYLFKRAYTKSHYVAGVVCYSYKDDDNNTCYTTSLDYTDTDLQNQPPADL